MKYTSCSRQHGAALLIALGVTVLAAVIAVGAIEYGELDMRRSSALIRANQAQQLALGLEDWAITLLRRDREDPRSGRFDGLDDFWRQPLPETVIPGGSIRASLTDLDGRFNLNSLLKPDGSVDQLALERFRRLLAILQLDPAIADQLLDWMDSNQIATERGAEDAHYSGRQALTANRPLAHVSELRILPAIDPAGYRRLLPFVQATDSRDPINVNTAPAEVLQSLAPDLTPDMINRVIVARGSGFQQLQAFLELDVFAETPIAARDLAVLSRNYRAITEIRLEDAVTRFETLLRGTDSVYHVRSRRRVLFQD